MAEASSRTSSLGRLACSWSASRRSLCCFGTGPSSPWSRLIGCLRPSWWWSGGTVGTPWGTSGSSPSSLRAKSTAGGLPSLCACWPGAFGTLGWWASKPSPYIFTKIHYLALWSFCPASPSNPTRLSDPTRSDFDFRGWGFSSRTSICFLCRCTCWRRGWGRMSATFRWCRSRWIWHSRGRSGRWSALWTCICPTIARSEWPQPRNQSARDKWGGPGYFPQHSPSKFHAGGIFSVLIYHSPGGWSRWHAWGWLWLAFESIQLMPFAPHCSLFCLFCCSQ